MQRRTYTRGPYKRYLSDPSLPIPRQTRFNWRCVADEGIDDLPGLSATSSFDPTLQDGHSSATPMDLEPEVSDALCCPGADDDGIGSDSESSSESDLESEQNTSGDEMGGALPAGAREGGANLQQAHSSPAYHPLYPDAQITEEEGIMLILSLSTKHRLTQSALSDILRVVSIHLPQGTTPASYRLV